MEISRNFHVISTLISSREKHAVSLSFSYSVFHMFLVNTEITWNVANAVLDLSKKVSIMAPYINIKHGDKSKSI